jgi:hypothetical protein
MIPSRHIHSGSETEILWTEYPARCHKGDFYRSSIRRSGRHGAELFAEG